MWHVLIVECTTVWSNITHFMHNVMCTSLSTDEYHWFYFYNSSKFEVFSHMHICYFAPERFLEDQQLTFLIFPYKSLCIDVYTLIATKPIYFVFTSLAKLLNGSIASIIPKHHRQTLIFHYYLYYARLKRDTWRTTERVWRKG